MFLTKTKCNIMLAIVKELSFYSQFNWARTLRNIKTNPSLAW